MQEMETLKSQVRERYGAIAKEKQGSAGCCSPGCCGGSAAPAGLSMNDDYQGTKGHVAEADLGLGCGLPVQFAALKAGETVLDLGSGAGNDAFVAAAEVGPQGKVIGVDMTPEMVALARRNAEKTGHDQVSFRLGELEHLPVDSDSVDVIISNCVINLVPDKAAAFREMARVLKPGGRFVLSDILVEGNMPDALRQIVELYAGCVGGAVGSEPYTQALQQAGLSEVVLAEKKPYPLDASAVQPHLPEGFDLGGLLSGFTIYKAIITGQKPKTT